KGCKSFRSSRLPSRSVAGQRPTGTLRPFFKRLAWCGAELHDLEPAQLKKYQGRCHTGSKSREQGPGQFPESKRYRGGAAVYRPAGACGLAPGFLSLRLRRSRPWDFIPNPEKLFEKSFIKN